MKKLHLSIYKSFIGPFLVAFFVILFILVLQFLSKYIDELFGKQVDKSILFQIFLYACGTMVTMALPLGILLSSLLTMGNMGERYELAAMKSAGIGLFKSMRPMVYFTICVTAFAFFFSFYLIPISNLKLYSLIFDMSKVKPTFQLKPGHFYGGIDNFVIHVAEIDRETDMLYKIKVYDHTGETGNLKVIIADSGRMLPNKSGTAMHLDMFDGVSHEDIPREGTNDKIYKYHRFYFDTLAYDIMLTGFNFNKTSEDAYKPHHYMQNIVELKHGVDSLRKHIDTIRADLKDYMVKYVKMEGISSPRTDPEKCYYLDSTVIDIFPWDKQEAILNQAIHNSRAVKNYAFTIGNRIEQESEKERKFDTEFQFRFALPLACIVFLFIGAPLGAIIRKGGIGVPILVSVMFFILFYVLMLQGRKLARDEIISVWVGVWLPHLVLFPFALIFTYQSATDSPLMFSAGWYNFFFNIRVFLARIFPFLKKKDKPVKARTIVDELFEESEKKK